MATVSSAGVGSGLELEKLITDLVNAQSTPQTNQLNIREASITAQVSAYGSLKSAVSELNSSLFNLSLTSTFTGRTATSADSSVFSASADATAASGSYDIEVVSLAAANKVRSASFANSQTTIGTGTLNIAIGSNSFNVTIDSSNSTLSGIKSAIEKADTSDLVTATIVTVDSGTQLVLTSNTTGLTNNIAVTVTDDDGNNTDNAGLSQLATGNLTQLTSGANASILIDTQTVTSSSNQFKDAIQGVTIDAAKVSAAPGTTTSLTVGVNTSLAKNEVTKFVDAYNKFITTTNDLTAFNPTTQVTGTLFGDSLTRGLLSQVRGILGEQVSGLTGAVQRISDLGLETQRDGSISLNTLTLDSRIASNFNDIQTLFSSTDGIATKLTTTLGAFVNTNGIIDDKTQNLDQGLKNISAERTQLSFRLGKYEEGLRKQFTNLDRLVSSLRSQSSFLSQQLSSLPGFTNNSSNSS